MKKFMMSLVLVSMTTVIASAQWYAFKSGKKNYKMMERSTLLADANRTGNANKSIKQLNKMQGKQEKQNKKSFQFK